MIFATSQSPWQPYHEHPGKGKGRPVVPESEVFGGLLVAMLLVVVWMRRDKR